ncbi:MAG: hypothetical protein IT303_19775 [Dehalococcoidia bacterium]|nr:hypothetical protein [Dehalococcoidia bacterium]
MDAPVPPAEQTALLLARIELAKQWDRDDEAYWRHATLEERARAIVELSRAADAMRAARGTPWPFEPFAFPRLGQRD